jgi:hypothetical protein
MAEWEGIPPAQETGPWAKWNHLDKKSNQQV